MPDVKKLIFIYSNGFIINIRWVANQTLFDSFL